MMRTRLSTYLAAAAIWALAAVAQAQTNSLDALNVAAQGGRVIVRVTTKQPLAAPPASFTGCP